MEMHFLRTCSIFNELVSQTNFHPTNAYSNWKRLHEQWSVKRQMSCEPLLLSNTVFQGIAKKLQLCCLPGHQIAGLNQM